MPLKGVEAMYKPADLLFVRGDGPISTAIERIEDSVYSHVAGVVKQGELFEAQALRNTGYQALDRYDGHADLFTCASLSDSQRTGITQFVLSKAGTHYAYRLLALEFEHYVFHLHPQYNDDGREYDCSQLWLDAHRSVGVDLCPNVTFASPGDLATSKLLRKVGSL